MLTTPEAEARVKIDHLLRASGWVIQSAKAVNLHAAQGVAVCEFPLKTGHGFADYLLFVDKRAVGVVEAKKEGTTLKGVETQSAKYGDGLPETLKAVIRPLPFLYESTGIETQFTNRLDPEPRSRPVFGFHHPATLAEWAGPTPISSNGKLGIGEGRAVYDARATLRKRLREMPPLVTTGLWPAQISAVENLEASLALDKPRALIQMATGSGKTFTSITSIYRLIKFGGAKRSFFWSIAATWDGKR